MRDLTIAWRGILRHARRTLITVSALVVGLAGMVVFQGFLGQMMQGFRDGTILSGVGHLQIAASPRYFVDGEFNPFAIRSQGLRLPCRVPRKRTASDGGLSFNRVCGRCQDLGISLPRSW